MQIITQAIRVIDYENNIVSSRQIMPKFGEYIEQLVDYISKQTSVREYKTQSIGTEVIGSVLNICKNQTDQDVIEHNVNMIAERLLREERSVQEKIDRMDIKVQKGSLILALLENEGNMQFLIAKVEHTDFFDDVDYSIKSGFSKDAKKIWKTCLFEIDDVSATQFVAKIYSNTAAKYWWYDFLELQELQSDENNTKRAFQAVESTLNKVIKKESPYDYMVIRNSIYLYFNSVDYFDYTDMLNSTVKNYTPNDMTEERKGELLRKLQALPEESHFDHQFTPVSSIIKPKMKKTYDVYNGIQLRVLGAIEDIKDVICAYRDDDGTQYLKVRLNNDSTFQIFERR